ncbi:unnamed protein product [Phytophthora fragariaefolia]|uniref:Unnamed protein product n=1 Tax=Phytophthora fragariaefolia TaxID=1490495 RepID=A0A9W6YCN3_9STRA|nr:unnamed protein product [Phytophthora fragariaefolia]
MVFERTRAFPSLHEACVAGDREQVRVLLNSPGGCTLERDVCGRIALHHAVITENVKIARTLLRRRDAKLQVHARDNSGRTALHYALEKMELLALHRPEGLRVPELVTAEMRTESKRYRRLWELADRMLEMISRRALEGDWITSEGQIDSLMKLDMRCRGDAWDTCRSGDLERLEKITKIYGCSTEKWELSELKRTLLHEACENQQLQIVHFLLSTIEVPVQAQDASGCTALHCAARRGFLEVCQLLLEKTLIDSSEPCKDLNNTAEQLAVIQDVRGRTALHWCLLGFGDSLARLHIGELLSRSCPAAVHIRDYDEISPLQLAIWRGNIKMVQQLIRLGASVCVLKSSTLLHHREEYPKKAIWAPCGIIFQRRCVRGSHKAMSPFVSVEKMVSDDDSAVSCAKCAPHWESVVHPVEALWYWTQQRRSSLPVGTKIGKRIMEHKTNVSVLSDNELGCRKYGGVCDQCRDITTSPNTASSTIDIKFQLLSPLILAIRMCTLTSDNCLPHRVTIVEVLLESGGILDEWRDGEENEDSNSRNEEWSKSSSPSALEEGLRAFPRCPQVLSMLLQYGAKQISICNIRRWCLSLSLSDANQVEAALRILLGIDAIASSYEFLTMLFTRKYISVLRELMWSWDGMSQVVASEKNPAMEYDDKNGCLPRRTPWGCIHNEMVSWGKDRRKCSEVTIDIEHLAFLCGEVSFIQQFSGHNTKLQDAEKSRLIEYCVLQYLKQHASLSVADLHSENDAIIKTTSECDKIMLPCIHVLISYWETIGDDNQHMKAKATAWLQPIIFLGYFECALVLLETLNRLGVRTRLLDTVFELYSSAIGYRRYHKHRILCHHLAFLVVCSENLLKQDNVASARSLVHMCANNMSLDLIKICFNTVFPGEFTNFPSDKVNGKSMVQWIVFHARFDIMHWTIETVPEGSERGSYWSKLIVASAAVNVGVSENAGKSSSNLLDKVLSAYQELVQRHLTVCERRDLLVTLMVKYVIPNDCVVLATRLVTFAVEVALADELNDKRNTMYALKEWRVFHCIARWNAVRMAEYFLSDQGLTDDSDVNWQHVFFDQIQEPHESDECTPLELCRLLGHNHLLSLLSDKVLHDKISPAKPDDDAEDAKTSKLETVVVSDTVKMASNWHVGELRSVLDINENLMTKNVEEARSVRGYRRLINAQSGWLSAVMLNQVSRLEAMALTRPQYTDPDLSVCKLILLAIRTASLAALKWMMQAYFPVTKHLSDAESVACLNSAAKHPGDVYAEMTLLFLQNQLSPGRLSGDGMGTPLLHRAACFSNTSLACRIMDMLLQRSDCDVNALDAFGNTAVSYALAAGRLHNACFLLQNLKCRLEAEFEGQACFYYMLHIVPSFASRVVMRALLIAKRDRAFLHCDGDSKTCGCKSYERVQDNNDDSIQALCGFCGHEPSSHRIMPLPSWFRDQYDTYAPAQNSDRERSHSSLDEDSDGETPHHYQAEFDAVGDDDEETVLENGRGRLDVALLKRITELRYDDILCANGLAVAQDAEETVIASSEHASRDDRRPTWNISTEIESGAVACCTTIEESPRSAVDGMLQQDADKSVGSNGSSSRRRVPAKFTDYPWWLRQELAMVHAPRCLCQASAFVISPIQLVHVAVCRWLRHTAIGYKRQQHATVIRDQSSSCSSSGVTESAIVALASVQPAFEHWRDVARLDAREPAEAVPRPSTPLPRVLSVLFHWRHGKEFLAFQRWKNHRTSAEVSHHRLATRLEQVAADMRRNRFATLQLRQQQLQESIRGLIAPPP